MKVLNLTKHRYLIVILVVGLLVGGLAWHMLTIARNVQPAGTDVGAEPARVNVSAQWMPYTSGQVLSAAGVRLGYPAGWVVRVRSASREQGPSDRLEFDFLPPEVTHGPSTEEWLGWGVMTVDVVSHYDSIQDYISAELGDDAQFLETHTVSIGNRTGYFVLADPTSSNPASLGFARRWVVLGSTHSYVISFSQNSADDFSTQMQESVFPAMVFE